MTLSQKQLELLLSAYSRSQSITKILGRCYFSAQRKQNESIPAEIKLLIEMLPALVKDAEELHQRLTRKI